MEIKEHMEWIEDISSALRIHVQGGAEAEDAQANTAVKQEMTIKVGRLAADDGLTINKGLQFHGQRTKTPVLAYAHPGARFHGRGIQHKVGIGLKEVFEEQRVD